ncbi:lipopolysaccharide core biosynthesis protein WbcM [Neokomagataea thailandica NBRC 106555]|nr:lipopolysaccharide core biosynthesis protein WbcM [Neokomagataea thailandica NBRC 106555]
MNGLARKGSRVHLVELVSRGPSTYPLDSSIPVESLFDQPVKIFNSWFRIVKRLSDYLKKYKIDTLIVVESTHALYGVAAARLAGARCIVWEHFNYTVTLGRRKRVWGRAVAAKWAADVVVLTSEDAELWRHRAKPRAQITVIPNMAPPVVARAYDTSSRLILTAGRLTEQKGYDLLLKAWALVVKEQDVSGWSLLIRGDGPDRDSLQERASDLPMVSLQPATEGIARDYARAAIYVCSSRYEGLPMVLLEAASEGIPVISYDCTTGPAEIIEHGVSGILVPPENVTLLAEGLLSLIRSEAVRLSMAKNIKKRAEAFQEGPVIERWLSLLAH